MNEMKRTRSVRLFSQEYIYIKGKLMDSQTNRQFLFVYFKSIQYFKFSPHQDETIKFAKQSEN